VEHASEFRRSVRVHKLTATRRQDPG